jgi:cell division protein FtsX
MSSKIKNIIILVVVAVALVLVYVFVIKKDPADQALLTSSSNNPISSDLSTNSDGSTSQMNEDFILMLLSVKSIRLEDAIFKDQAFTSLQDSSIVLVQLGDEGRPNPFAPIGAESAGISEPQIEEEVPPIDSGPTE